MQSFSAANLSMYDPAKHKTQGYYYISLVMSSSLDLVGLHALRFIDAKIAWVYFSKTSSLFVFFLGGKHVCKLLSRQCEKLFK